MIGAGGATVGSRAGEVTREVGGEVTVTDVVTEVHEAAVMAPTTASGASRAPTDGRRVWQRKRMAGNGTSDARTVP